MRRRTVTGNRYETRCPDDCGSVFTLSDTAWAVIDLDLPAGKGAYLFPHSPGAGSGRGTDAAGLPAHPRLRMGGTAMRPASRPRAPSHRLPRRLQSRLYSPYGPTPIPLALLGSAGVVEPSPSAQASRAGVTLQLTLRAAAYEPCKGPVLALLVGVLLGISWHVAHPSRARSKRSLMGPWVSTIGREIPSRPRYRGAIGIECASRSGLPERSGHAAGGSVLGNRRYARIVSFPLHPFPSTNSTPRPKRILEAPW